MRETVTEETLQPLRGCACNQVGCTAHEHPDTGADETADAPLMFLVKRNGRLLAVCPTCTHIASDLVVARLYNGVMNLQPFMKWDVSRVVKLFDVFRFSLPVEAAYLADPAKYEAEAQKTLDAIREQVMTALGSAMVQRLDAATAQTQEPDTKERAAGPLGFLAPSKISKFGES